jgi:hypothetical protein
LPESLDAAISAKPVVEACNVGRAACFFKIRTTRRRHLHTHSHLAALIDGPARHNISKPLNRIRLIDSRESRDERYLPRPETLRRLANIILPCQAYHLFHNCPGPRHDEEPHNSRVLTSFSSLEGPSSRPSACSWIFYCAQRGKVAWVYHVPS